MKTGHFEETWIHHEALPPKGGSRGESTQDGRSTSDCDVTRSWLVFPTDRPGAGCSPGDAARYVRRAEASPEGDSGDGSDQNRPNLPAGSGPQSLAEPHREFILECLDRGLSCQRIRQDLQTEHVFAGPSEPPLTSEASADSRSLWSVATATRVTRLVRGRRSALICTRHRTYRTAETVADRG